MATGDLSPEPDVTASVEAALHAGRIDDAKRIATESLDVVVDPEEAVELHTIVQAIAECEEDWETALTHSWELRRLALEQDDSVAACRHYARAMRHLSALGRLEQTMEGLDYLQSEIQAIERRLFDDDETTDMASHAEDATIERAYGFILTDYNLAVFQYHVQASKEIEPKLLTEQIAEMVADDMPAWAQASWQRAWGWLEARMGNTEKVLPHYLEAERLAREAKAYRLALEALRDQVRYSRQTLGREVLGAGKRACELLRKAMAAGYSAREVHEFVTVVREIEAVVPTGLKLL